MKQFTKYSLFSMALLAGAAAFTACSSDDNIVEETAPVNPSYNGETVKTEFAINIPRANVNKRMTADNTQNTATSGNNNFLGMEAIRLIPLTTTTAGTLATAGAQNITSIIQLANIDALNGEGSSSITNNEGQKIYSDVEIPTGTNTFLFYGQAKYATTYSGDDSDADKWFSQGALETSLDGNAITQVNDITFNLKKILDDDSKLNTPQAALLDQLNDVVTAFSNITTSTSNADQETLFQLLTNLKTLKAGSANAIKATMEMLYNAVADIASGTEGTGDTDPVKIAKAIQAAIAANTPDSDSNIKEAPLFTAAAGTTGEYTLSWRTGVADDIKDFPASLYLPEGAMQVEWDDDASPSATFVYLNDQSNSGNGVVVGTGNNTVPLNSLTYPASLAYYVCSTVKANDDAAAQFPTAGSWESTSNQWNNWGDAVEATSRLVALEKNVDYAVASMKTTVKFGKANVEDNRYAVSGNQQPNNIITIGNQTFKLTGILVGGQPSMTGYDLLPFNTTSHGDGTAATADMTVYDNLEMANDASTTPIYVTTTDMPAPIYTLLLDNKGMGTSNAEAETVNFALELVNNSGVAFYGQGGIVEKGMKFYLVGTLNTNSGNGNATAPGPSNSNVNRIFLQDYQTTANVTINSLANAYVTIPDLRATNLKLGLSVDLKWEQGYTFNVGIN